MTHPLSVSLSVRLPVCLLANNSKGYEWIFPRGHKATYLYFSKGGSHNTWGK